MNVFSGGKFLTVLFPFKLHLAYPSQKYTRLVGSWLYLTWHHELSQTTLPPWFSNPSDKRRTKNNSTTSTIIPVSTARSSSRKLFQITIFCLSRSLTRPTKTIQTIEQRRASAMRRSRAQCCVQMNGFLLGTCMPSYQSSPNKESTHIPATERKLA